MNSKMVRGFGVPAIAARTAVSLALAVAIPLALAAAGCSSNVEASAPAASVTKTIGPEGGTIVVDGATVTFPPNAVTAATSITITKTAEAAPAGFVALSPVFHCEPSGTTFGQKVTMAMSFEGDPATATMFWSTNASPAFTDVGGSASGAVMSAGVLHFSSGFVGKKP